MLKHRLHRLTHHSKLAQRLQSLNRRIWEPYRQRRLRRFERAEPDYSISHDKTLSVTEAARKMVRKRCGARTDKMAAWIMGTQDYVVAVAGCMICVEVDREIAADLAAQGGVVIELREEDVIEGVLS